jgi:hypothetical protein
MNSVELMVTDLVQIAEAPLYSTYRWLGRQLGRDLPLGEFLRLVDELIARDVLRLWEVDHRSHDRTELFGVPEGLEERYRTAEGLDESFDPFGLSLTLGTAADVEAEPSWEVDFDFERGRFELLAEAGIDDDAVKQASRYFPDVALVAEQREPAGGRVRIVGRIDAA